MHEPPLPSPIVTHDERGSPIVLSVPHSGRDCPDWLARKTIGGASALAALSDPYVDRLAAPLIEKGFAAVVAQAPRAAIDPNRQSDALDPDVHPHAAPPLPGSKAAQGLGLVIARGLGGRPLWRGTIGAAALKERIESAWSPYHRALESALGQARQRHGIAILVDCHSMPPRRRGLAQLVLGDRHGSSAARWVSDMAADAASELGLDVGFNQPFAGGAITARHGDPARGVHAIQVEMDRSLYLDHTLKSPGAGVGRAQALLARIVGALERGAEGEVARAAE